MAPAAPNAIAVALPIPDAPPVTKATLSCSIILFLLFQSSDHGTD
ncbi:hypothetical protein AVDCRST_MAG94-3425 [uncultured Leptolyngbya sp.]|uniref:Uncharacterized protein n=1 Tax=uncultured Leptolyngbya sp. TaxID=332963 RepID=A0A6J4MKL3_9CYAN|nr:hypothetical protein AVDCRST_MAG94-3425 [uncultured Leptolyngbya sp.]